MPAPLPSLDVVVPLHDAIAHLPRVLPPLERALADGALGRIWIVDDASADGGGEWCEARGHSILRTDRRRGPAAARNLGVEASTADWVLFVDSDVAVPEDLPARFRRAIAEEPGRVAVFGSYDDRPEAAGRLSVCRNLLHHWFHQQAPREATTFWAGCGAVHRESFLRVGGFDALRHPEPSIEDVELGTRLLAAGRIALRPELQARHLKRWTWTGMIATDFARRAVPWTRLMAREGATVRRLNVSPHEQRRAALSLLIPAALLSLPWSGPAGAGVAALAGLVTLALDRPFLALVHRRIGVGGALVAFAMLRCYYAVAVSAWLWARCTPAPGGSPGSSVDRGPRPQ